MEKSAKKLNKSNIVKLIKEEAEFILTKEEYHKKVTKLNDELKNLYENRDFVGTFGFKGDDKSKSISGFADTPNISYIAQLEKEFNAEDLKSEETLNEEELNEIGKLQKENESLKKEMDEIKTFISEMKNKK